MHQQYRRSTEAKSLPEWAPHEATEGPGEWALFNNRQWRHSHLAAQSCEALHACLRFLSRPLTSVADHTPWLEVEEEKKNRARAHTQHKHQRWPELCRGDDKIELALFTELQWEAIYVTLPIKS